eukprot:3797852-Prymnesium_polylepis.1
MSTRLSWFIASVPAGPLSIRTIRTTLPDCSGRRVRRRSGEWLHGSRTRPLRRGVRRRFCGMLCGGGSGSS